VRCVLVGFSGRVGSLIIIVVGEFRGCVVKFLGVFF